MKAIQKNKGSHIHFSYLCVRMEENFDALNVIARTRGEVQMDDMPTGDGIFQIWGWLTVLFFLLEFFCWRRFEAVWCQFLWIGIPLVGTPLMSRLISRDRARTHVRTRRSKVVLDYWIFAGAACCLGGFALGFADLDKVCLNPLVGLLVGIGSFLTGEVLRFRPMVFCGIAGAAIGIASFLLQGDLWAWQLLGVALVAALSLVLPGYLFNRHIKNGV